jgi:hypothetical protein
LLFDADNVKPGCLPCRFTHKRNGSLTGLHYDGERGEVRPPEASAALPLAPSDVHHVAFDQPGSFLEVPDPVTSKLPYHVPGMRPRRVYTAVRPPQPEEMSIDEVVAGGVDELGAYMYAAIDSGANEHVIYQGLAAEASESYPAGDDVLGLTGPITPIREVVLPISALGFDGETHVMRLHAPVLPGEGIHIFSVSALHPDCETTVHLEPDPVIEFSDGSKGPLLRWNGLYLVKLYASTEAERWEVTDPCEDLVLLERDDADILEPQSAAVQVNEAVSQTSPSAVAPTESAVFAPDKMSDGYSWYADTPTATATRLSDSDVASVVATSGADHARVGRKPVTSTYIDVPHPALPALCMPHLLAYVGGVGCTTLTALCVPCCGDSVGGAPFGSSRGVAMPAAASVAPCDTVLRVAGGPPEGYAFSAHLKRRLDP